jgi:pyruvate dehydrogenase E1 component alpha subunit
MGDGATSRGDWHEGLNLAAVFRLPVVYVCVNNQYAYSTPLERQMAVPRIVDRAAGYGMPVDLVDGNDVLAVREVARRAIARARGGGGPSFIECVTYRLRGHGAHDDNRYVPRDFLEAGERRDPIAGFTRALHDRGMLDEAGREELDRRIAAEVEVAWTEAERSPLPAGTDTLDGVFAP